MKEIAGLKVEYKKKNTKLKLVLLPPKEQKEVNNEDIRYFYKNLAYILMSEN